MADARGPSGSGFKNSAGAGKQAFLPPKSPFPSMPQTSVDYGSGNVIGPKGIQRPNYKHHQRTSSESLLVEEQPLWLDDLLNEPETPVRRGGHRRSSSDSAFLDAAANFSMDNLALDGYRHWNLVSMPSRNSGEFDYLNDVHHLGYYTDSNSFRGAQSRGWDSSLNNVNYPSSNHMPVKEKAVHLGSSSGMREHSIVAPVVAANQDKQEGTQDQKGSSERKEGSQGKHPQSDIDTKRVKQQYAQRSRVRKLQYISELERNVQALQAEGLEVSAELEFLNQQNLMLDLENKALKQRLDSLAQEHLIKCLQHEMLEREIARLRASLFHQQQQQQQQQQPTTNHSRRNSRDLDSQFASLSLNHKEANSGRDPVNGSLRI